MPASYISGHEYKGTQSFEGKWAGTGFYPEETLPYFDFYFKGKQAEHTGYMPNELLFETLTTNSPDIKLLNLERRNLDSETMGAIMNCLLGNTQVTELKIARNVSFWSEQPDDFGMALAAVLADKSSNITKVCARRLPIPSTIVHGSHADYAFGSRSLRWSGGHKEQRHSRGSHRGHHGGAQDEYQGDVVGHV